MRPEAPPSMDPAVDGKALTLLRQFDGEKAKREAIVAESRERERTRKDAHDQIFAKVKKQAADGPVARTLRDIDID